jgi:enterochelin esterase-like enzyme
MYLGFLKARFPSPQDETTAAKLEETIVSQKGIDALEKTTIIQDPDSPTGYSVTFRYKDPDATRVRLSGQWLFSDKAHASLATSLNATPEAWKNGYFVHRQGKWPTVDMTLDQESGVWAHTIPLPNGTWAYTFYVGGVEDADPQDRTDAEQVWDPTNPPLLHDYEATDMVPNELRSDIYVPYDAQKQSLSDNVSEQAPRHGENGSAFFAKVDTTDDKEAVFGIYLPYEHDVSRKDPYPILVLVHGSHEVESTWFNQGALIHILDNMIAQGRVEPMIVVTPNGTDVDWDFPQLLSDILDGILPYMEANYNAATDPSRRAYGGLSSGGVTTMYALFHHTQAFGYYLPMSAFITNNFEPNYQADGIKDVRICFGYGWYEFVFSKYVEPQRATAISALLHDIFIDLAEAGVSFTNHAVYGGHTWTTWRQNIVHMLENVLWQSRRYGHRSWTNIASVIRQINVTSGGEE